MIHNVLVLASAALPDSRSDRLHLGLSADPRGAGRGEEIMRFVRLEALGPTAAALLCRLMIRCGGTGRPAGARRGAGRAVLLGGGGRAFATMLPLARRRPVTRDPALQIEEAFERAGTPPRSLALRRGRLSLDDGPIVMGILNVTPDSFSDGGRFGRPRQAIEQALRMADEGAAIIDVGGESTRPGSHPVPLKEELRRVLPVLEGLRRRLARRRARSPLISIDTTKAEVARRAAEVGADMVNDISGLSFDPAMPAIVAETGLPVVVQHIRGRPRTMQRSPRYAQLLPEIAAFLRRQIALLSSAGVRPDRIVIDPGLGFGKRRRHNIAILRHLHVLRSLGLPILIGASRKSFLSGALELPIPERLEVSLAAEALALAGGADIIRAHDVREAVRVARLCHAVLHGPT